MDEFLIPADLVRDMIDHAQAEYPKECCGFLTGPSGQASAIARLRNADPDPVMKYRADSRDVKRVLEDLDDLDHEVVCVYHSHTHTPPYPSRTDIEESRGLPDAIYALVGLSDRGHPEVRAYRIAAGGVTEVTIRETTTVEGA